MDYPTLNLAVQQYTENNEFSFVANVPVFIRMAEKRIYNEVKLPQFRKSTTWRLVPSSALQVLPADFMASNSLLVNDGLGGVSYLDMKEPEYVMLAFGLDFGMPRVYALREDKELIVAPVPDASYDATLSYFFYPESITTVVSGHTWLGDNFEDVLLYGSLLEAYIYMKGEADVMQGYQLQYAASLKLLKDYAGRTSKSDTYRAVA